MDNRRLIGGMRQALDMNYTRLLEAAQMEWERNFAGKDPSDACVSVHISAGTSEGSSMLRAGALRNKGRSFLNGHGRRVPA